LCGLQQWRNLLVQNENRKQRKKKKKENEQEHDEAQPAKRQRALCAGDESEEKKKPDDVDVVVYRIICQAFDSYDPICLHRGELIRYLQNGNNKQPPPLMLRFENRSVAEVVIGRILKHARPYRNQNHPLSFQLESRDFSTALIRILRPFGSFFTRYATKAIRLRCIAKTPQFNTLMTTRRATKKLNSRNTMHF
jgi:hypothetical protein